MTQSSMQRYRLQALVLTGGALLALIAFVVAVTVPSVSCTSIVVAQEPAGGAVLAPADDPGPARDLEPADFNLSVFPPKQWVMHGAATSYTISVTASPTFSAKVSLEVGPLPLPGWMEHNLDPVSVEPPGEATLTLTATHAAIAGTYPLTVTGTTDDMTAEAPFTLIVPASETFLPVVARDCPYVCRWPWDEPNDNRTQAIPLTPGSEYSSFICSGDPGDYFSVMLESLTTLKLRLTNLTNLPAGVDYDLYLFDADGELIARSDAYGQVNEQIVHDIDQAGVYYILVYPYSGSSSDVPYVLAVQVDS